MFKQCNFGVVFLFGVLNVLADKAIADEKDQINVVATFSVLADMVSRVGGDYVEVTSLVGWGEDAHVFHASPNDVKRVANADLLVTNGFGFEGWLERLISAAKYRGRLLAATEHVSGIYLEGESHDEDELSHSEDAHAGHAHDEAVFDPHAWHSFTAAKVYIQNISKALQSIDIKHQDIYRANARLYIDELELLEASVDKAMKSIPLKQRRIVVPHNAFAYMAREYSLHIHSLQGLSTEAESSAAQIAQVIRQVRAFHIQAIFTENISNDRLIRVVQQETGVKMGGTLISGALSEDLSPSYLDMMKYNTDMIVRALQ